MSMEMLGDGVFIVHDKEVRFSQTSLFCLKSDNQLRIGLIWLTEWK
jgi:hypothetical protein